MIPTLLNDKEVIQTPAFDKQVQPSGCINSTDVLKPKINNNIMSAADYEEEQENCNRRVAMMFKVHLDKEDK